MKRSFATSLVCIAGTLSGLLASATGCTDLFHSTDFADNLLPLSTTLPLADKEQARTLAKDICLRTSSCLGPIGNNRYGACVVFATEALAPATALAPNRSLQSTWICLANARTCDDVQTCTFRSKLGDCKSANAAPVCAEGLDAARVFCPESGPASIAEPCALYGQSCREGQCVSGTATCNVGLAKCDGDSAVGCDFTTDTGRDCSSYENATCAAKAGISSVTCKSKSGAPSCNESNDILCAGSVAKACRGGVEDRFDCSTLGLECTKRSVGPTEVFAARQACTGTTNTCAVDRCDGNNLVPCVHDKTAAAVDCVAAGYRACEETLVPLRDKDTRVPVARCVP